MGRALSPDATASLQSAIGVASRRRGSRPIQAAGRHQAGAGYHRAQAYCFRSNSHSSGLEVGRDHAPDMHGHGAFGLVLRRAEALPVPLRAMDFDVG